MRLLHYNELPVERQTFKGAVVAVWFVAALSEPDEIQF